MIEINRILGGKICAVSPFNRVMREGQGRGHHTGVGTSAGKESSALSSCAPFLKKKKRKKEKHWFLPLFNYVTKLLMSSIPLVTILYTPSLVLSYHSVFFFLTSDEVLWFLASDRSELKFHLWAVCPWPFPSLVTKWKIKLTTSCDGMRWMK